MRYLVILAAMLAFTGCKKNGSETSSSTSPDKDVKASSAINMPAMPPKPVMPTEDPKTVLMEVNGVKLTAGEANQEVEFRLASLAKDMPPERVEAVRPRLRDNIIEQFVLKTILQQEVERQKITVTEDEIKQAFEDIKKNLPEGMTLEEIMKTSPIGEEKMKEEVVTGLKINKILAQAISNAAAVTDAEIDKFYEENKEMVKVPESVQASHILVKFEDADTDAIKSEKKKKAEGIRSMLVSGSNFVEVAKANSDCPSKENGGDLGKFTREQMVPAFSDSAFSLETNKISELVLTKFGYHIIKVSAHEKAGQVPRDDIKKYLGETRKQETLRKTIDNLRSKAVIKDLRPKVEQPEGMPSFFPPSEQAQKPAPQQKPPAPAPESPADKAPVAEVNANK